MTASDVRQRTAGPGPASPGQRRDRPAVSVDQPLLRAGAIAACTVTGAGLAVIIVLVLVGFIAAPHAGFGLPAVLRASAALWLVGHHVGFSFRGAGRIGMLPLGLVLLPGALLWRAGRWVVRAGQVRRLRHVGYAALALAAPYALLTGALALASRSSLESSSLLQSVACGFLLAFAAGGLGGARTLAPWPQLVRLLPRQARAMVVAICGALAALAAAGALVAGLSMAVHLHQAVKLEESLAPGTVGMFLLLLLQIGYLPNAVIWAAAFTLGPGFAFGSSTVVAPTGSALTQLPAFPMLAALPPGLHAAMPGWLEPVVLALPYAAGALGGLLLVRTVLHRAGPPLALDAAPLWGLACGAVCGCILAVLAAVSGGPLGDGRLTEVGPSAWQTGLVSALEIGVSAAVAAGAVNYAALRRAGALAAGDPADGARPGASQAGVTQAGVTQSGVTRAGEDETGHVIYVDPWAGDPPVEPNPPGPSALP